MARAQCILLVHIYIYSISHFIRGIWCGFFCVQLICMYSFLRRPEGIPLSSLTLSMSPAASLARISALLCGKQLIFVIMSQLHFWGQEDTAVVVTTQPGTSGTWLWFIPVWDVFPVMRGKIGRTLREGETGGGWFFQGTVLHCLFMQGGCGKRLAGCGQQASGFGFFLHYMKEFLYSEVLQKAVCIVFSKSHEVYSTIMCTNETQGQPATPSS